MKIELTKEEIKILISGLKTKITKETKNWIFNNPIRDNLIKRKKFLLSL